MGKKRISKLSQFLTILLLLFLGILTYWHYKEVVSEFRDKMEYKVSVGYRRNTLIVIYEAIANYLQFEENYEKPKEIEKIRSMFLDQEIRDFTQKNFPLMQSKDWLVSIRNNSPNKKKKNLIIIMFESLPQSEIYALSKNPDYRGTTPFFNTLLKKSIYFPNTYASGIHTFFGVSDILTGVSSFNFISWNKKISLKLDFGLPSVLTDNGYLESAWYHGGTPNFDHQLSFSKAVGFKHTVFNNKFSKKAKKSNWGISDKELFARAAQDIKKMPEPFFVFIQTLTKHGPWNIPPDFDQAGFKRDYIDQHDPNFPKEGLRNSRKLIYYSDQVLKNFFTELDNNPKFKNSLVIITSDQAFFPDIKGKNYYETMVNGFRIPLIFYEPGIKPQKIDVFASHLDIIPTIINYLSLNSKNEIPYMGKNLFNTIHQKDIGMHSHLAFWNGKIIHFTPQGIYENNNNFNSTPNFIDLEGTLKPSQNHPINQFFFNFQSIYPYLIKNNLVYNIMK